VHYWASPIEAKLCVNQEVALVGAGNSAGQAAVYLASQGAKVWMLVRGDDLAATMSRYLVDRIRGLNNLEVVTGAIVSGLEGRDGILEAVRWGSAQPAKRYGGRSGTCSCLSALSPIRTGSSTQASFLIPRALFSPATMPAATAIR
jgi:thioredoxin reductase